MLRKRLGSKLKPVPVKPERTMGGDSLLSPAEIHEVFSRFAAAMPEPQTELARM